MISTRNGYVLAIALGGVLAGAGCGGQVLTIGSNGGAGTDAGDHPPGDAGDHPPGDAGDHPPGDAGSHPPGDAAMAGDAGAGDDSSVAADGGPPPTIAVTTCSGDAADVAATLGVGFTATAPSDCDTVSGPAHPVASAADLSGLLVGDWSECAFADFFGMETDAASAIELTAGGQYHLLGPTADGSLARLDSIPGAPDAGPLDGTWAVADGSATYGAGTYELELQPAGGGLFAGQVTLTDSPLQLHHIVTSTDPNVSPKTVDHIYARPAPWSPRAGVCSCVSAQAIKVDESSPMGLAAAIVGRWVWCGDEPLPQGPTLPLPPDVVPSLGLLDVGIGIDFTSDGAWYLLEEDSTGTLTRFPAPVGRGTYSFVPGGLYTGGVPKGAITAFFSQEPMTLVLQGSSGGTFETVAVVTESPRALLLNTARQVAGQTFAENAVLFPAE